MPREPLMPDSTAPGRPISPDAGIGSERKRRRKVLSCYDCRRRKLQCDRAMPACGRCTKAGQAANCLYIDDPTTDPPGRPGESDLGRAPNDDVRQQAAQPPSGDLLARLEYQDRKIKQLEAALSESAHHPTLPGQPTAASKHPLTPESVGATAIEATSSAASVIDRETMLLRGKSFKTQFYGMTYTGSLVAYIPELSAFTKETFETFPALHRIKQEMHALENRTAYAGSDPQNATDADLSAALPSKMDTDRLVQLYFDNYDSIYHIIHGPSFRQDYKDMWTDFANVRPHFVAIVLLMAATSYLLMDSAPSQYNANSSNAREKGMATIALCEGWLQRQSQKHVTVADFQIRLLLVIAKLINASKFKRTWTDAGNMLRFFMAAGLHRNPDHLRKPTSALDKEMRRRLWFAAAEFELQASFDRGMISAPWPQQGDCPPPNNIYDEDIDQKTDHLPISRPISEFTGTSYLIAANETFNLRYTLNTILNNIRQNLSFEDTKRYTEEIESHIRNMPQWIGTTSSAPQALLSLNLRQYLLILHDRQFRLANSPSEKTYSKLTLVSTATKIFSTYKTLLAHKTLALQFLCHDQVRAALSICHIASTPDPHADAILTDFIATRAVALVSDAIDLLADKVTRYGREQRQLWIVLAANALMKTQMEPGRKLEYMQEAIDKITRPYYKILACQDEPVGGVRGTATAPASGGREDPTSGVLEYMPSGGQGKGGGEVGMVDPPLLDLEDLAAWTFDDWNFVGGIDGGVGG